MLLDYKTDRDADAEKLRRRYEVQLALYAEAVEDILGRRVDECYLYLLRNGTFVAMARRTSGKQTVNCIIKSDT